MSNLMENFKTRIVAALAMMIASAAFCPGQGQYVVMLQQTPANGGSINPGTGVHSFQANSAMTVTAVPKPGYQFVYWLGDVTDPTSATTVLSVNAPKIVVAVFERSEYELLDKEQASPDGSGGGDRLVPARNGIAGPSGISPATGQNSYSYKGPTYNFPEKPPEDKPDDGDEPPTVPEPATMLLLGLGSLLAARKQN